MGGKRFPLLFVMTCLLLFLYKSFDYRKNYQSLNIPTKEFCFEKEYRKAISNGIPVNDIHRRIEILLSPERPCKQQNVLIIVKSYAGNFLRRSAIRQT